MFPEIPSVMSLENPPETSSWFPDDNVYGIFPGIILGISTIILKENFSRTPTTIVLGIPPETFHEVLHEVLQKFLWFFLEQFR